VDIDRIMSFFYAEKWWEMILIEYHRLDKCREALRTSGWFFIGSSALRKLPLLVGSLDWKGHRQLILLIIIGLVYFYFLLIKIIVHLNENYLKTS
jgi:hypothetical protein